MMLMHAASAFVWRCVITHHYIFFTGSDEAIPLPGIMEREFALVVKFLQQFNAAPFCKINRVCVADVYTMYMMVVCNKCMRMFMLFLGSLYRLTIAKASWKC
jgi:hypothetical protein